MGGTNEEEMDGTNEEEMDGDSAFGALDLVFLFPTSAVLLPLMGEGI